MGSDDRQPLTAFFIPYFATGHMIPLVDIARLLAARGVDSTVLATPANAALIQRTVDYAAATGLPIRTLTYPFPAAESGLPPGVENISRLPPADAHRIDDATWHVRPSHERLIRAHRPNAVFSDIHFPWTTAMAKEVGAVRISFDALGLFPISVMNVLFGKLPHLAVTRDDEQFLVPGLPHPIHMVRPELPDFLRGKTHITGLMESIGEAEAGSLGVVVNSFLEMESEYADYYYKATNRKLWCVGPVSLAYTAGDDVATRGSDNPAAAANRRQCFDWLEGKEAGSVVYVAFGSWSHFSDEQLREMAAGLEFSGHPFIWVVRDDGATWMPAGFEEQLAGRGLVVRGWAPQVSVLGHAAVGGFVTHCGWNSVLEGVTSGLPMATLPLSTEQFINEKLVVDVLGVAVRISEAPRGTADGDSAIVPAADVTRAVDRIMACNDEATTMRAAVRRLGAAARVAVKEGGSSYVGLTRLIDEIRAGSRKESKV